MWTKVELLRARLCISENLLYQVGFCTNGPCWNLVWNNSVLAAFSRAPADRGTPGLVDTLQLVSVSSRALMLPECHPREY